jgi:tetratricopeptide (TPR) repeat protein
MEADNKIELGLMYYQGGDLQNAKSIFEETLKAQPNNFDALYYLAIVNYQMEDYDETILNIKKALNRNPVNAEANNLFGNVLMVKGEVKEAIISYQKAIEINPYFADAYNNLGMTYMYSTQLDEAIKYFQKAIEINPNFAEAHVNMSFILLLSGKLEQGWKEYEWRWGLEDSFNDLSYSYIPVWDGFDVRERTVLIHAEQGFGDSIQFIRYIPMVATRGANIILDCPKELMSLFKNIEDVTQLILKTDYDDIDIDVDVRCPILSLPYIFGTTLDTIPSNVPYLRADLNLIRKWREKISKDNSNATKIGLIWAGSTSKKKLRRSYSLSLFSPLLEIENVTFYSLQKGEASKQAKDIPYSMRLIDYTEDINDFSDTAAIIESLDLVISIDTAVAHLTGALGKPVWTLLPFSPDWRWMLNRDDSPWYPTMRLFRQPSQGDWETVIEKVKDELQKWLGNY